MSDYKFIRDSAIRIPICKDMEWFKNIVRDLTRKNKAYNSQSKDEFEIKKFYDIDEVNKELLIPRFYRINNCSYELEDRIPDGQLIDIKSKVVPRNERQNESIEWFKNHDRGVLCLGPGEGKTVIAISTICSIGRKAIIFTHKDSLVDQWIDRFTQFSSITQNQIIKLTTSKCNEILTNYPIVISTVQTFCSMLKRISNMRELMIQANFGIAIWDECHTSVSAEQFSRTSLNVPCKRVFGLSATPSRHDGNTDIINLHLGTVFTPQLGSTDTMQPRVVVLKFKFGVMSRHYNYIMHKTKYDWDNGVKKPYFDMSRYLSQLKKSNKYVDVLKKVVNKIANSNRHLLLLTDRIKLLDIASEVCKDKSEVGFFIPRSGKNRDEHLTRRLVFSTYGSSRDGTDKKEIDCLVLATPVSNIEQATGRAVRSSPGKDQPVIIDLVDMEDDSLMGRYHYRLGFYNRKNWNVEEKEID